jgi:hypothetical protein
MLLKFKITEEFQYNDWATVNIKRMVWDKIRYSITDQHDKFYFFRFVTIDNSPTSDIPRYFPLFIKNHNFHEQGLAFSDYIIENKHVFANRNLIPVVLDPLEGFSETTLTVREIADRIKDICPLYFVNGNNKLTKTENNFKFYVTNHWIHHLRDDSVSRANLNENHRVYISLNRMAREHRVMLTSKLINNNLRDFGYISWANGRNHQYIDYTENYPEIHNTKFDILDVPDVLQSNPTRQIPLKQCNDSFLFLVTETHFDTDTIFLSEKTFKSVLVGMPFIVLGNPGTLTVLKELGFKTFDRWIDESYDSDISLNDRCDIIVREINRFSNMSNDQRIKIRKEMEEILEHNLKTLRELMRRSDLIESLMDIGKQIYTSRK